MPQGQFEKVHKEDHILSNVVVKNKQTRGTKNEEFLLVCLLRATEELINNEKSSGSTCSSTMLTFIPPKED